MAGVFQKCFYFFISISITTLRLFKTNWTKIEGQLLMSVTAVLPDTGIVEY